jgi:energy-coupling factor transporter transmembrane protein EcfT
MTPYAYRPGSTFLHRAPGGIKLLGLFLISIGGFFPVYGQLCGVLLLILGSISAKIRPWELLRGGAPLVTTAAFVILLRSVRFAGPESGFIVYSCSGFIEGLLFGLGIILAFSAGALLFSVTTMTELRDSLARAETVLWAWKGPQKAGFRGLSLGLSLMLGFLPRFFEIWEDADQAYQARCGKNGFSKLCTLIPRIIQGMIELAIETAAALEARGIGCDAQDFHSPS